MTDSRRENLLGLSWAGIIRLGLVQTALGAIIVLTTSTLNRIMVVELALPAMLPGFLVAVHHMVQIARPKIGYGSDLAGRRTPWIVIGMAVLAASGILAAFGTTYMAQSVTVGTALTLLGFVGIGLGSGATGTSLLVLLAKEVSIERKPAAATIVWFMMIAGFAVTAGIAGNYLDPYSPARLLTVTSIVSALAMVVTLVAIRGLESKQPSAAAHAATATAITETRAKAPNFRHALREVWQESAARRFTVFVFMSMLAYSFQDLILEPFAGLVFLMSPGESTQLSGTQHGGVLLGMIAVAVTGSAFKRHSAALLRWWTVSGCALSAIALGGIAFGGLHPDAWHLSANVFFLGFSNGAFAVAAIASMMVLAGRGKAQREGLRMGLWGAAQAIAFALGGFLGTVAVDVCRLWVAEPAHAYGMVFLLEAVLFVMSARLATQIPRTDSETNAAPRFGDIAAHEVIGCPDYKTGGSV